MPTIVFGANGSSTVPIKIKLPGRVAVNMPVKSVSGTRRGRIRLVLDPGDPWTMENGKKEVTTKEFSVGIGGTVVVEDIRFDASDEAGIILLELFVDEIVNGSPTGDEAQDSVNIGVLTT